jgi:phospho-2-dehydro-3-deoxyheptonate aldolase
VYGQSITDACVDFETTEQMLRMLAQAVGTRGAIAVS